MRIGIVLHRSDCDVKRVTCHYRGYNANCFGLSSPIVTEDDVLHSFGESSGLAILYNDRWLCRHCIILPMDRRKASDKKDRR